MGPAPPPPRARCTSAGGPPPRRWTATGKGSAARRLRSVTPAWEASALAARPPSGDLRVARLPCRFLVRERALTLLHFRLASLRSLRVEEAAGVQVQDALAPVLRMHPLHQSPSRRAATEPSATVARHQSPRPARPPAASRRPPTSHRTVPRTSVPCAHRMKSSGSFVGHASAARLSRQKKRLWPSDFLTRRAGLLRARRRDQDG